jgi:hypothetical protein
MKTFKIDIHPTLKNVEVTVKNGAEFTRALISGEYSNFQFTTNENDSKRIKKFAIKSGNDNCSNKGKWYAHCNGYAMDLLVHYNDSFSINTYRPYGKNSV